MDTLPSVALKAMVLDIQKTIDHGVEELRDELEASTPIYTGQMKESWESEHWSDWEWRIDNMAEDEDGFYSSWVFAGQSKSHWNGMAVVARSEKMIEQDLVNLGVY